MSIILRVRDRVFCCRDESTANLYASSNTLQTLSWSLGMLISDYVQVPYQVVLDWINLSLRFATEFATDAHAWRSVGARLRLGQLHKSLFDKHKPFIHNSLQTAHSDQISDAPALPRIPGFEVRGFMIFACDRLTPKRDLSDCCAASIRTLHVG